MASKKKKTSAEVFAEQREDIERQAQRVEVTPTPPAPYVPTGVSTRGGVWPPAYVPPVLTIAGEKQDAPLLSGMIAPPSKSVAVRVSVTSITGRARLELLGSFGNDQWQTFQSCELLPPLGDVLFPHLSFRFGRPYEVMPTMRPAVPTLEVVRVAAYPLTKRSHFEATARIEFDFEQPHTSFGSEHKPRITIEDSQELTLG